MAKPFPGDRRRDTSCELTEVRTVHSRAKTALKTVRDRPAYLERMFKEYGPASWRPHDADPDNADMVAALEQVVVLLERWSR